MKKRENIIKSLLSKSRNFYQLKKELDNYYNTIEDKQDFLEWFEYDILEKGIIKIRSDIELLSSNNTNHNTFTIIGNIRLQIYQNCLKWVSDKKKDIQHQPETLDLSDTTGTEKIIMLSLLGVLDFLKEKQPFMSSTNQLAVVLSGITGIKQSTIYPMINPILRGNAVVQKNNPFQTEKTVNKVKQKLILAGYKLDD